MADVEVAEQPQTASNTYIIRPNFQHKFRPVIVKECIHNCLNEHLDGKRYDPEELTDWTKTIADDIKNKLKDMGYDRYKFIVQIAIGEQRGEGVKMGARCFWDSDTDNYAQDIFMNVIVKLYLDFSKHGIELLFESPVLHLKNYFPFIDSIFCVAAVFGVFYY